MKDLSQTMSGNKVQFCINMTFIYYETLEYDIFKNNNEKLALYKM